MLNLFPLPRNLRGVAMNRNDIDRARSALFCIPPNLGREEWHKIGCAAIAAGLTVDDIDEWSAPAENYEGRKSVEASFKTIQPNGGIGPGTLFYHAQQYGYRDEKPQQRTNSANLQNCDGGKGGKTVSTPDAPTKLWDQCTEATPAHPYILAKRGSPEGLRVVPSDCKQVISGQKIAGGLAVPVRSHDGTLRTLQLIPLEGKKVNLPGASFGDGFHIVGDTSQSDRLFITEGIGQAWACWSATGSAAVVTFGAGRMAAITSLLQTYYPTHKRVLVPDRGKEVQAAEIARTASCAWVELPEDTPTNYDANDYAAEYGADELDELLRAPKYPPQRFKVLSAADVEAIPRAPDLVKGVLPREGLAAIGGPSGSGKSFVAMDLLGAVAAGAPWFGIRTHSAPVLYVALEGEGGLGKRLKAYRERYGSVPRRLMFLAAPLDIRDATDRAELIQAAKQAGVVGGVVCIDTLNRAAPGMDENASTDMGQVIEAMKQLQDALGGLVVAVHHTGKDLTKGLRGHSSLFAALDAVIEVTREGLQRSWKVGKSKDDEDGRSYPFRLKVIQVGEDDEGEPVTSCIVELDDAAISVRRALPPKAGNQKIIWDGLSELLRNAGNLPPKGAPDCLPLGRPALRIDDAIEQLRTRLVCEPKRQTERARSAVTGLISRGLLDSREGFIWIV